MPTMEEKVLADLKAMTDEEFNKQEQMLGKSLHLIPSNFEFIPIEKVQLHPEWQPRLRTDENRLFNSICVEGLATSPRVFINEKQGLPMNDGKPHALDARHRWAALYKIQRERPLVWQRHQFDRGIKCQVFHNLTEDQILDLRTDEGRSQEPLSGKVEAWRALLPHYNSGKSDKQIEANYWKILADTCCSTSKRSELYEKFRKSTDPREFLASIHNATYVHQQLFRALFRTPNIVREQWVKGESGYADPQTGKIADKLTSADISKLSKAHLADIAEDEAQGFKNKIGPDKPGPGCTAALKTLLAEKASVTKEVEPKPMSKTERQTHVENGKSQAEKIIFSAIGGNPAMAAQLPTVLVNIGQWEAAREVDTVTFDEFVIALTKRAAKLEDSERVELLQIIRKHEVEPTTKKGKGK